MNETLVLHSKAGVFEDVRDDLRLAIEGRGLVIDHVSRIGAMLERTRADVGATRTLYRQAEAFSFCSAVVSRRMLEADPANIAVCPHVIACYERAEQPGRIWLSYRRPPPGPGMDEVAALFAAIVKDALG